MTNRSFLSNAEKQKVRSILEDVRVRRDKAVIEWTEHFDNVKLRNIEITNEECKKAYTLCGVSLIKSLQQAIANIKKFAQKQKSFLKPMRIKTAPGIVIGEKWVPLDSVGIYVPGGRYPLPSTALMTVIPAKLAGVKEIVVCSPPTFKGSIHPAILVAADMAGATRIFRVGGVQAVGAMAFGTQHIPGVAKIIGPGNRFVAFAKKEVFGVVGIDLIAGPSEVAIIADTASNPEFVAADLLAQAEHDPDAVPILISLSESIEKRIKQQMEKQLKVLPTRQIAQRSLDRNLRVISVSNEKQAAQVANALAPEHLEIHTINPELLFSAITNAGSCFLGNHSAEAFGDYCSGPSHVLPTGGAAKYMSGLSVRDFMKSITYHKISKKGVKRLSKATQEIALAEGLFGHAHAANVRVKRR